MGRVSILFIVLFAACQAGLASADPDSVNNAFSTPSQIFYPDYSYDYIPDTDYDEIADRISCMKSEIPLNFNQTVKGFIDYFAVRDREYTRNIIRKKEVYFPTFEKYLKEYGLPDELKYLSIIESGLNPQAVSRAK
jgi:membrane-bound lytic murein transglycosylase D